MEENYEYTKPNKVYAIQVSEFNSGKCRFVYFEYDEGCSDIAKAYGISNALRKRRDFSFFDTKDILYLLDEGNFILNEELADKPFGYDGSHYSLIIHDRICVLKRDVNYLSNDMKIEEDVYESDCGDFKTIDMENRDYVYDFVSFLHKVEQNAHGGFKMFKNDESVDRSLFDFPEIRRAINEMVKKTTNEFIECVENNKFPFSFYDHAKNKYTIRKRCIYSMSDLEKYI